MLKNDRRSESTFRLVHSRPAPLLRLPPATLAGMESAGQELVACYQDLAQRRRNLLLEVLGDTPCVEWEHYPSDDLIDHGGYCLSYYHAHSAADRQDDEHGHFHVFARLPPLRRRPGPWIERGVSLPWRDAPANADSPDALVHLVAISVDTKGVPFRLFTTNQWVTNETWCAADDAIALLRRVCARRDENPPLVSRWLNAMLNLFHPQIVALLRERDATVVKWAKRHRGRIPAIQDRRLEVVSSRRIAPDEQLQAIAVMETSDA